MEIIKHGNTYSTTECNECGCKFTYSRIDLQSESYYGKEVRCPECNNCIKIRKQETRYGN